MIAEYHGERLEQIIFHGAGITACGRDRETVELAPCRDLVDCRSCHRAQYSWSGNRDDWDVEW
jgi:hypothetical protein